MPPPTKAEYPEPGHFRIDTWSAVDGYGQRHFDLLWREPGGRPHGQVYRANAVEAAARMVAGGYVDDGVREI